MARLFGFQRDQDTSIYGCQNTWFKFLAYNGGTWEVFEVIYMMRLKMSYILPLIKNPYLKRDCTQFDLMALN